MFPRSIRRVVVALLALCIVATVIAVALFLRVLSPARIELTENNWREVWQATRSKDRLSVAHELAARRYLIGLSSSDLSDSLGPPRLRDPGRRMSWYAGSEPSPASMHFPYDYHLTVYFDEHDRANKIVVERFD
jgi:hypothetical protein